MKTKKKLISILLTVSMMLTMFPFAAFAQDANDAESKVVYPDGVTVASFTDDKVIYIDQVKEGNSEHYYSTFKDALAASAKDATLYCKEGAFIPNDGNHISIPHSLTIEGNGATQVFSIKDDKIEAGEANFSVEEYQNFNEDVVFTVNRLNNASVWGTRKTAYTFTLYLNDCGVNTNYNNGMRVYINGETGDNHINITGCTYENLTPCTVYSSAGGTVNIKNTTFNGIQEPININTKEGARDKIINVEGCIFNDCVTASDASDVQWAAPIRIVNSGSSKNALNVKDCTFNYSEGKSSTNGDILLGDGRNGGISNNIMMTIVNTAADVQMQKPGYYTAGGKTEASKLQTATIAKSDLPTTLNVVEAFAVAKVEDKYYESLEEAVRAANDKTVTLLKDVTINTWNQVWNAKELTIDGNGKTLTVGKVESNGNGDFLFYGAENLNVSDLNVVFNGKGNGFDMKSGSLTNVKMTGADKATNKYAVFVGASDGKVSINGCTFKNFGMGVYSQPTGQPTAAIAIDKSNFDNCDYVLVSYAADTAFTNNIVTNSGKDGEISFAAAADSANNAENIKYTVTGNTLQDAGKVWFYGGDLNKVDFEKNKVLGNTKVDTTDAKADTTLDVSNNYWGGQAPSKDQIVDDSDAIKGDDVYYKADTMKPEDLNTYQPSTGGGVVTRYDVTLADTDNGSITATHKRASKNSTVTITATPDEGYVVDAMTVTEKDGDKVEVTKKDDNKYTFKMPASDVTVKVTFKMAQTEPEKPSGLPFTDVAKDAWYFPAVEYVFNNGLMNGTTATTFAPNVELNRAMMAAVLYNMEGKPACDKSGLFSDVENGKWYTDAVNWAASNNIVSGMPDGTYAPNQALTREQMASVLYRYAEYKGIDVSARADLSTFTDGTTVSPWAQDVVQWAVAEKLMSGNGNELQPKGTASRAQVATVLMNYCENVAK